jgi:hypothetical protein
MRRRAGEQERRSNTIRARIRGVLVLGAMLVFAPDAEAVDFSGPTDYTSNISVSLASGDFNADGDPDLVGAAYAGGVNVMLGGAGGAFTGPTNFPLTGGGYPSGVALGDFNADTDPDLAIATSSGVEVLRGGAGGSFAAPLGPYPAGNYPDDVAVDSFDGDSDPDLVVANYYSGDVSILHGGAGATFGAPTSYSLGGSTPIAIATGNFNGDAYRDVVTANNAATTNRLSVLLGGPSGLGAPTHYNAGDSYNFYYESGSLAIGDFNGDADPDIAVGNRLSDSVSILLGSTGGSFTGPTDLTLAPGSYPSGVALGKFNADTDPDLVVADWGNPNGDIAVLLGGTGGTFGAPIYFPASNPIYVVVGDFDADTDDDVATAAYANGNSSILLQVNTVGYARPLSATPATIRLVPAFTACTTSNATHGGPLNQPSCNPPVQSSSFLTWNASDRPAPYNTTVSGTGLLQMKIFCTNSQSPPCPAVGDQEDVELSSTITDVRCVSAGPNCSGAGGLYYGKLLFELPLRITDKLNGAGLSAGATATDIQFQFGIQCSSGYCSATTSTDSVIPNMARESKRAVWELGKIQVRDGGTDGDLIDAPSPAVGTCPPVCAGNGGETVFLTQGFLAP